MTDPGYIDPRAYVKKALKKKFDNLENQVASSIFRNTVGLPRRLRDNEEMLTCNFINQHAPIKFGVKPIKGTTLMDAVAGSWGFTTWPPRHQTELTALLDLSDAYPDEPIALCVKYGAPMQLMAYFHDPENVILPVPSMCITLPIRDTVGRVLITPLDRLLATAKEHYREFLPEHILYD